MVDITVSSPVWHLKPIIVEQSGKTSRVSVEFEGSPIWFESDDAVLEPSIEAFAGLLLLPSLRHRAKLKIDTPVDAQWLENIRQLCQIYSQWWGFDADCPVEATTQPSTVPPSPAVGLCFTGGVDSFYSLLQYPGQIDRLIYAHGYDMPLDDLPRFDAYRKSLAAIAASIGKPAIIIRTNLHNHSLFRSVSWYKTHGSALAALGLLLSRQIGSLIIPPSYASTRLRPWGSHPDTDPLFSTAQCRLLHHSTELSRLERIQAIAEHHLVQQHLRVCFGLDQKNLIGNCSKCEKCVMTMVALAGTGYFQHCKTFSHSKSLVTRVNELSFTSPHLAALWKELASVEKTPELQSAIYRAVQRRRQPKQSKPSFSTRLLSKLKRLSLKRLFLKCQRLFAQLKQG